MSIIDGIGADNTDVEANVLNPEANSFHLNTSKSNISAINDTNDVLLSWETKSCLSPIAFNISNPSESEAIFIEVNK